MGRQIGSRKLVDIAGSSTRLHGILEKWLDQQAIPYSKHFHDCEGFVRYYVNIRDLSCAKAVLPALHQIAEEGRAA